MELTWQNVLVQAIPVLGGALAALLGALPGYFKDKRELASKERLAADERTFAREDTRQAKAYEERKNAYTDYLSVLRNVINALPQGEYDRNLDIANMSHSTILLFCSRNVKVEAIKTLSALYDVVSVTTGPIDKSLENFQCYLKAFDKLVSAMRQDLGVHKTELC